MRCTYRTAKLEDAHEGLSGTGLLGDELARARRRRSGGGELALLLARAGHLVLRGDLVAVALHRLGIVSGVPRARCIRRGGAYLKLLWPRADEGVALSEQARLLFVVHGVVVGAGLMRGDCAEHAIVLRTHDTVHAAALIAGAAAAR